MLKNFEFTKGKKIAVLSIVVLLLFTGCFGAYRIKSSKAAGEEESQETATVERRDLKKTLVLSGTVTSENQVAVSAKASDVKVLSMNVKVGDRVKAGDVIATLDDSQLQRQLEIAISTKTNTQSKNAIDLASANRSYNQTVEEAAKLSARAENDVVNTANELAAAVSRADNAQSVYDTKKAEYDNALTDAELSDDEKETKRTELADAKSTLDSALEAKKSAQDAYDKANEAKEDQTATNTKNIYDQSDALKTAKISASEGELSQEDEISKLTEQIDSCTVKAPIDGIVTATKVKTGDSYKGDELAIIQDDSGFKIYANADQHDISGIEVGMPVQITTDGTGDNAMKGKISFVSPTPVEMQSQTEQQTSQTGSKYAIEADIEDPDSKIRIGMTSKLTIALAEVTDVLCVASNAIQSDENQKAYVEVKSKKSTKKVYLTEGISADGYTAVSAKNLKSGQTVILPKEDISSKDNSDGLEGLFY